MTGQFDSSRPFTRRQAIQAGIPAHALKSKRFRSIFRGIYAESQTSLTPIVRAEAALLPFDSTAFASHATAARLHQAAIPTLPEEHITVVKRNDRRSRGGVVCHEVGGQPIRVTLVSGLRVSAPEMMFAELADLLDLVNLVVVGDDIIRRGLCTLKTLREALTEVNGTRGRKAREAVAYVRERVDSPMESRLRMLLVLAGVPEPQINYVVRDMEGQPARRFDLCWPQVRVIVEYDGRHHIERESQWESDLQRREEIDDHNWRILVVTAQGVYTQPEQTVARVWRLLHDRRLPGLPPRARDDWRPHFPGHRRAA